MLSIMGTGPNNGLMDPELANFILKGPHYTGNFMNPKKTLESTHFVTLEKNHREAKDDKFTQQTW
jgi:hypothetical protein